MLDSSTIDVIPQNGLCKVVGMVSSQDDMSYIGTACAWPAC